MSTFTAEQIEFIEHTLSGINISGSLTDVIRISHVAEGILAKLAEMRKELSSVQPEPPSQTPPDEFRGILKE